jgi:hypothetical protein
MAYLVRVQASADANRVAWLGPKRLAGLRTFAPKETAEPFDSKEAAQAAVAAMRDKDECRGIVFSVEDAS